jgi:hypothetical protein
MKLSECPTGCFFPTHWLTVAILVMLPKMVGEVAQEATKWYWL